MYANYTAKVQEVLQVGTITTDIQPVAFEERLEDFLNSRLALIIESTNVSSSALSGVIIVAQPGRPLNVAVQTANFNPSARRRMQTVEALDTSSCDENALRINVEILMETTGHEDRDQFMELFDSTVLPQLVANITGNGANAAVCAAGAVTEASRETVNAPPPPPTLGLTTEPDGPVSPTVILIAAILGTLVLLVCGGYVAYLVLGRNRSGDKEELEAQPLRAALVTSTGLGRAGKPTANKRYFVLEAPDLGGE